MNREEIHHLRDRLLMLAECSHKPQNVKRKSSNSAAKPRSKSGPKWSMQDFVRRDPGYTADIEHLVFPGRKRNSLQEPGVVQAKARSRLAEMFALSRHLQQRSADREVKPRAAFVNRSVDSAMEASGRGRATTTSASSTSPASAVLAAAPPEDASSSRTVQRKTKTTPSSCLVKSAPPAKFASRQSSSAAAPVAANSMATATATAASTAISSAKHSPATTDEMTATRPTVSIIHLRATPDVWDMSPTSAFAASTTNSRTVSAARSNSAGLPQLTKHQSLGNAPTQTYLYGDEPGPSSGCNRELSPVRWCDREVDGVYLGRSGWVQVQQRSLDENRKCNYYGKSVSNSLELSQRTGIKLANYNYHSEPAKSRTNQEKQRPAYLPLFSRNDEVLPRTPSPPLPLQDSPPPSITPIISPPPAFQDRKEHLYRTKHKRPFLPRSDAILDGELISPQISPPTERKTQSSTRKQKLSPSPVRPSQLYPRLPQAKSLEDATNRRSRFVRSEPASSSTTTVGFRSLDSCVGRQVMPRLSETTTDSSVDIYEDADDEDNNSSSLNLSLVSTLLHSSMESLRTSKVSPSGRANKPCNNHRYQTRRSPGGSDNNRHSSRSSSSSSTEGCARKSPSQQVRRITTARHGNKLPAEESHRVRRSRSLQLPEKKPVVLAHSRSPPQYADSYRVVGKGPRRPAMMPPKIQSMEEEMLREAKIVSDFVYSSRSRAAAQALLKQRYEEVDDDRPKGPINLDIVYVGKNERPKVLLQRGATTPTACRQFKSPTNPCNSISCDFWPHCAHRDTLNSRTQSMMRLSHSYPTHQRSLDSSSNERGGRAFESMANQSPPEPKPARVKGSVDTHQYRVECANTLRADYNQRGKRTGPGGIRNGGKVRSGNSNSSSSGSDMWMGSDRSGRGVMGARGSGVPGSVENAVRVKENVNVSRPGSAPMDDKYRPLEAQQKSMSLPKSFLSATYQPGGHNQRMAGTESLGSSPGSQRRTPTPEAVRTAPVTPSHEINRRRSPVGNSERNVKASSTPHLLDQTHANRRKWAQKSHTLGGATVPTTGIKELTAQHSFPGGTTSESVLQKFRKQFSLRFQRKGGKDHPETSDHYAEIAKHQLPSEEEDSPQRVPSMSTVSIKSESSEQKHRFGPLIWRSSKERKTSKANRNAKCNSGDSGIQIEMASGCGGGGGGGDSSESHDTDPLADDLDSPPLVRRRPFSSRLAARPLSDLVNQNLIDKVKADWQNRTNRYVRRTHSDLGGQRLFHWELRASYRRHMSSRQSSRRNSARKMDATNASLRNNTLRRSLSQPIDIDKLSPLMRMKTGPRNGTSNVLSEDEHDNRNAASDSDSESSAVSFRERKRSMDSHDHDPDDCVILAEAVFDHVSIDPEELGFRAGDVIEVLETVNRDWWWCSTAGREGWVRADSIRLRVSQDDTLEDCITAMTSGKHLHRRTSISLLSNDQVRTSVVRELVYTEREFVKVLQDVSEGYLAECRKRTDMFSAAQINGIFSNLEAILQFQLGFLRELESCIDWDAPHKSNVGSCFTRRRADFEMYSDYCNGHPVATAMLQELYQSNRYSKFFEACRLMRGLIEIPLNGYLLTPVQRICKYPLQLAELLKYTRTDHPDYDNVREALNSMKEVAMLINERKRRMESLEKLAVWQQRVDGWEGEDLIEGSTQLLHQGEVVRVSSGMWTHNITLFLFDHQLVYCKKDILKRNIYIYKGRMDMHTSDVVDIQDGKDSQIGVTVRHAIRIHSNLRDKWLSFYCRNAAEKQQWLDAFAEEKRLRADQCERLQFPAAAKQLARIAAQTQRRPPHKRRGKSHKMGLTYMGSTLQLSAQSSHSLGRKVGTWFTFGVNRKTRHQHRDLS